MSRAESAREAETEMSERRNAFTFRVTVRYTTRTQQYEVFEVEAASLAEALRSAAERIPAAAQISADLVEVRRANPATPST